MAAIDYRAVEARHPLAEVARRTGFSLAADSGDTMVCCAMPDHHDDTPSMMLHLDTNRYHCFGCDRSGDVVQWVRDIYEVRAGEAVTMLDAPGPFPVPPQGTPTERHIGPAPGPRSEQPNPERTPANRVRAALRDAWGYYTYGALGHAGHAYLAGRGIDVVELEAETGQVMVGHTPFKAPDQLVKWLRAKGYRDDELVDAGLARRVASRLAGGEPVVYDYYQARVVVPVRDDNENVIGLIGRYDGDHVADKKPKYMNPPRTAVYDKSTVLYRPSKSPLTPDGQVVAVEGVIDALAIAAAAAQAGYSSKFAPLCESGTAFSGAQVEMILAIHPRPPVLALDGDVTGSAANVKLATAIAVMGREAAIVTWPPGEDPASWLEKRGTAGLAALTRKGCLEAPADELRPRHSGDQVAKSQIGNTHGGLEARWRAALAPAERMREKPAERYATAAVETLAPVVVTAAIEACADNAGRVNDVILTVASYGRRLPSAAVLRYAELAALEIEKADLGPSGWATPRIETAMAVRTHDRAGEGVAPAALTVVPG